MTSPGRWKIAALIQCERTVKGLLALRLVASFDVKRVAL